MSDEYVEVTVRVPETKVDQVRSFVDALLTEENSTRIMVDKIEKELRAKIARIEKNEFSEAAFDRFLDIRFRSIDTINDLRFQISRKEFDLEAAILKIKGEIAMRDALRDMLLSQLERTNLVLDALISGCALNESNQEKDKILTSESLS